MSCFEVGGSRTNGHYYARAYFCHPNISLEILHVDKVKVESPENNTMAAWSVYGVIHERQSVTSNFQAMLT